MTCLAKYDTLKSISVQNSVESYKIIDWAKRPYNLTVKQIERCLSIHNQFPLYLELIFIPSYSPAFNTNIVFNFEKNVIRLVLE